MSEGNPSLTNPPANSIFGRLATGAITTLIYLCYLKLPTLLPTFSLRPLMPKFHAPCSFITALVPSRRVMGSIFRQTSRIVPFPSILTISMILETPAWLNLRGSPLVCIATLSLMQNIHNTGSYTPRCSSSLPGPTPQPCQKYQKSKVTS
jgi:hypothetical protein